MLPTNVPTKTTSGGIMIRMATILMALLLCNTSAPMATKAKAAQTPSKKMYLGSFIVPGGRRKNSVYAATVTPNLNVRFRFLI